MLWSVAPIILLLIDKKVRPQRKSLIRFISVFVVVQLLFSVFNMLGFRIYGEYSGMFYDSLICGTFTRYNHMANYLATFFFILCYEYFEHRSLRALYFYVLASFMGLLIAFSGSRMTTVLFVFTAFCFFSMYKSKKTVVLTIIGCTTFMSFYVLGNEHFLGQKADEGTGLERNMIGIIDFANSDDLSEGSTVALSAYLLLDKFDSPLLGNGKAYRGKEDFYFIPAGDKIGNFFRTDARLVFMLVEYGIIGLGLFLLLYYSIFKACYRYSEERRRCLYVGAFIYFLLFSLTDNGFWDYVQISILYIYVFSVIKGNHFEKDLVLTKHC